LSNKKKTKSSYPEIYPSRVAKTIIKRALKEDFGKRGDLTCRAIIDSNLSGTAVITAKEKGVISGQLVAEEVFNEVAKDTNYEILCPDGSYVKPGNVIARIKGKVWTILSAERTALNILGRCSGISTLTRAYMDAIKDTEAVITDTRKTAPGLRYLDKAAVVVGGGVNHRYALHDAFLIKENHLMASDSIEDAIQSCQQFAAKHGRFKVMVEVENLSQFAEAARAKPDRILLDNMSITDILYCVGQNDNNIELEATGGITLANVHDYAKTGVDTISTGSLTHSVRNLDLSLILVDCG